MRIDFELLVVDVVTGRRVGLAATVRRALRALDASEVPYAVIGAAALAARGLPRMTRDLDIAVVREDGFTALEALRKAGFHSVVPLAKTDDPEPMYVLQSRSGGEVDLLVAAGEPESTVVAEAPRTELFGVQAPVATLEHLALMYLYSNQPKHLGDFQRLVTDTRIDLASVERYLADVHPEMLGTLRDRVHQAKHPPPAPTRPKRRG